MRFCIAIFFFSVKSSRELVNPKFFLISKLQRKLNELLKKVGPDYAHAEARKSPALDGKVERDKDGKEVRYPVILSAKEKAIARQGKCVFFFVDKF